MANKTILHARENTNERLDIPEEYLKLETRSLGLPNERIRAPDWNALRAAAKQKFHGRIKGHT